MAIDFPDAPTNGQRYTASNGLTYLYQSASGWTLNQYRFSQVQSTQVAAAGQTAFPVPGGYAPGLVQVFKNGIKLVDSVGVLTTSGTSVVLASGASAGDTIDIVGLAAFTVAAGYLFSSIQYISAVSGLYTPSNGCRAVYVECQAPGGSGGGAALTGPGEAAVSSGGSGGGYCAKLITSLAPNYAYTVGTGGAAPAAGNNNGSDGAAATTFGGILTANPGLGGIGSASSATYLRTSGVVGGTATGGDINYTGGNSEAPAAAVGNVMVSPHGGDAILGPGRNFLTVSGAAVVGRSYGGGGSGVANGSSQVARAGAAGANGIIRITEYF